MISIKYKECHTICMPDEIVTTDGSDKKIPLTIQEIEFLYNLLDNVQIKGIETIMLINNLTLKLAPYHVPIPQDED